MVGSLNLDQILKITHTFFPKFVVHLERLGQKYARRNATSVRGGNKPVFQDSSCLQLNPLADSFTARISGQAVSSGLGISGQMCS